MSGNEIFRVKQVFNPPLVHSIATARPEWSPRQLGRLMAVARGDGRVALYDADQAQSSAGPQKKTKVGHTDGFQASCQPMRVGRCPAQALMPL